MTDITDKYDLVRQAFSDMDIVCDAYFSDTETPAEMTKMQARACVLIDKYLDRADADKERLMAAAIFYMVPSVVAQHFSPQGYGAAQPLINETVLQGKAMDEHAHLRTSLDLAQVQLACGLANNERILNRLHDGKLSREDFDFYKTNLNRLIDNGTESRYGASARRLVQVYNMAYDSLSEALNKPAKRPLPPSSSLQA
jgi:hypothetical protein